MTILSAVILGFVQGITEFIPISSSGHLIIVRDVLGLETQGALAFDAVLQLATSLAILFYFRHDFLRFIKRIAADTRSFFSPSQEERSGNVLLKALVLGSVPAAVLGLTLESYLETTFRSSLLVAITLIAGAGLMWAAERVATQEKTLTAKRGLGIGFFQSLALIPGISRSGSTIAGGLLFGLTRVEATRFSFMLGFPILFGSGLLKLFEIASDDITRSVGLELFIGSTVAFVVGLFAMHFLIRYLRTNSLNLFIYYRIILGVLLLVLLS